MVKNIPNKLNKKELLNLLKEKDKLILEKDRQIIKINRQIKLNKFENKKVYKELIKGCSASFYTKYNKTQEIINTNNKKENKTLLNKLKELLNNLSKNKKKNNKKKNLKIMMKLMILFM